MSAQSSTIAIEDTRNVILTGGSSGIGFATACKFLRDKNTHVVIIDKNPIPEKCKQKLDKIKHATSRFSFKQFDFVNTDKIAKMIEKVFNHHFNKTEINVLINNHAKFEFGKLGIPKTGSKTKTDCNIPLIDWKETFEINLISHAMNIQAVIPYMRKNKVQIQNFDSMQCAVDIKSYERGSIINICSTGSFHADAENVCYNSSKAALAHMTRCVAKDVGQLQVRVNAVAPGSVLTQASEEHMKLLFSNDKKWLRRGRRAFAKESVLNRQAHPLEIANVIHFLASPQSSFITGQIIVADGGALL
jgi:NAD(P)-dependent dehydrogenase (short-subunit alcohol dehydrogenase family)